MTAADVPTGRPAGDRRVVQCNVRDATKVFPAGARAYVARMNPGGGNDRIIVLGRSHGGRWVEHWQSIDNLRDFRAKTLPPDHPLFDDERIRDFGPDAENQAASLQELTTEGRTVYWAGGEPPGLTDSPVRVYAGGENPANARPVGDPIRVALDAAGDFEAAMAQVKEAADASPEDFKVLKAAVLARANPHPPESFAGRWWTFARALEEATAPALEWFIYRSPKQLMAALAVCFLILAVLAAILGSWVPIALGVVAWFGGGWLASRKEET